MADLISEVAAKAGIDSGLAQKGMGALLASLQDKLPAGAFSKVSSAVPNAASLVSAFQTSSGSSQQGASPSLGGLVGNLLGGQAESISNIISQFSKAGFTLDSAKAFIPVAIGLLKDKLPPETIKQVENAVPGLSSLLSDKDAGGLLGKVKNLF